MEKMADANARLVQSNSWPFVSKVLSEDQNEIVIGVRNDGVGPAKIHWIQLLYHGRAYPTLLDTLHECCGYQPGSAASPDTIDYGFGVVDGSVLRAGETNAFLRLKNEPTNALMYEPFRKQLLGISVRACYCSVFDECFIGDGASLQPQSLKVCPEPRVRYRPRG